MTCRICGTALGDHVVAAREMMLGLRDPFHYGECGECGCVQLLDPPEDWSRYYPSDYYSFADVPERGIRRRLKRWRARHAMGHPSPAGALLVRVSGRPLFAEWITRAGVDLNDAILDVGSGSGGLLLDMHDAGFTDLTGIDPYLDGDRELGPGARLLRRRLEEVEGPFDFVMMNHSFEHLEDPEGALREAARLLLPGHFLLLRVPVAGSYAWREYGADWVQLDAPRHLFLHTPTSIRLLAEPAGFTLEAARCDSTGFQFWGSEQYRKDIPLYDARSYSVAPDRSIFAPAAIREFERKAIELNEREDGDQAAFYLKSRVLSPES